jgi:acetyl-CoA C-acetyltransferase
MEIGDIDLFEVNEAFSSVVLRFMQAFDVDHDQGQRERRRHRHGPPAGRHRRDHPRHAARRAGAAGKATGLATLCVASAWARPRSSSGSE